MAARRCPTLMPCPREPGPAWALALILGVLRAPAGAQGMTQPELNPLSTLHARAPEETCDSEKEYWHQGRCCLYCQPGTHVLTHCTTPHTLGRCQPCPLGEYAPYNKLETCRPCTQCRNEQVMLRPCWNEVNAECGCKEGYYCETPDCATCQRCRKRCPEGEEILQACNATANTVCGAPGPGLPSGADSVHLPLRHFGFLVFLLSFTLVALAVLGVPIRTQIRNEEG